MPCAINFPHLTHWPPTLYIIKWSTAFQCMMYKCCCSFKKSLFVMLYFYMSLIHGWLRKWIKICHPCTIWSIYIIKPVYEFVFNNTRIVRPAPCFPKLCKLSIDVLSPSKSRTDHTHVKDLNVSQWPNGCLYNRYNTCVEIHQCSWCNYDMRYSVDIHVSLLITQITVRHHCNICSSIINQISIK